MGQVFGGTLITVRLFMRPSPHALVEREGVWSAGKRSVPDGEVVHTGPQPRLPGRDLTKAVIGSRQPVSGHDPCVTRNGCASSMVHRKSSLANGYGTFTCRSLAGALFRCDEVGRAALRSYSPLRYLLHSEPLPLPFGGSQFSAWQRMSRGVSLCTLGTCFI